MWEAFEHSAARDPSASALVFPHETVSFRELKGDAERCAAWLVGQGVQKGGVVALQLPKRREAYALWLGCLRQGAIYVFLDPANPAGRTDRIIQRIRPLVLITSLKSESGTSGILELESQKDGDRWLRSLPPADVLPAAAKLNGASPAYIMFTSGSTGEPKGAVVPHQGVLNLMRWAESLIGQPWKERISNLNPLHFDNSVFDLYCGLLSGATLVPVETGALPHPLDWVKLLRSGRASVVFAVPTLFLTLDSLRLLTPASIPDARMFLFGGEGYPIAALRRFYQRFEAVSRMVNVYGPTETSCICSSLELRREHLHVAGQRLAPLGRMHDDFEYAILNEEGEPVSPGDAGELWIGGPGVGLGYFASPEESSLRFVQDPRQNLFRSIWYRSGDIVREESDGLLWFHGRADNQVKIRGHRIELEEIDNAAQQMKAISRALCVAIPRNDSLELQLAFTADTALDLKMVRQHCEAVLPPYMQPVRIVQLESMPTNANGKVDRKSVCRTMGSLP